MSQYPNCNDFSNVRLKTILMSRIMMDAKLPIVWHKVCSKMLEVMYADRDQMDILFYNFQPWEQSQIQDSQFNTPIGLYNHCLLLINKSSHREDIDFIKKLQPIDKYNIGYEIVETLKKNIV